MNLKLKEKTSWNYEALSLLSCNYQVLKHINWRLMKLVKHTNFQALVPVRIKVGLYMEMCIRDRCLPFCLLHMRENCILFVFIDWRRVLFVIWYSTQAHPAAVTTDLKFWRTAKISFLWRIYLPTFSGRHY